MLMSNPNSVSLTEWGPREVLAGRSSSSEVFPSCPGESRSVLEELSVDQKKSAHLIYSESTYLIVNFI